MTKSETVSIFALAYGGDGVGRLADNRVCFVPGTLPGERVRIRIITEKKRFVKAEVEEIIGSSSERVVPPCPYYGKCPGCVYMHSSYAQEIAWKERQLEDFLLRNDLAVKEVIAAPFASPSELFYRNKLVLHNAGDGKYGYIGKDNVSVIPIRECLLADREINRILPEAAGEKALFRTSSHEGAQQILRESPGILHENVPGAGEFAVAGDGFFQTNIAVAAELVNEVKRAFAGFAGERVLELYCGVGVFSIALAGEYEKLRCTAVELNGQAIELARQNAVVNGVADRCSFFAGDAGKMLRRQRGKTGEDVALVLDPPRGGIAPETLKDILKINASLVVYISCAADTLARDLRQMVEASYKVERVRLLDMFPRTGHFEVCTVLRRK